MDDKRVIKVIKKVMPSVVSIAIAERFADLEKQFPKGFDSPRSRTAPWTTAAWYRPAADRALSLPERAHPHQQARGERAQSGIYSDPE